MKLDDFLQKEIIPQRLPSMWINSKKFVFQSDDGGLAVLDTATNTVSTLVTNHTIVGSLEKKKLKEKLLTKLFTSSAKLT